MPESDILQTKLTPPPVRPNHILRPRLAQQMSSILQHPITLICAPAGYGKSTLVGEWLSSEAKNTISFGWLSLDEEDNDPIRFLMYLITAVRNVSGINANELLSLLRSPQSLPPKALLNILVSQMEDLPHNLTVILDDYHRINNQAVHEAMNYLLHRLPSPIRFVIVSREDPPFPLSRFRGRGQLFELRADDLRFTLEETGQFLGQMLGDEVSAHQVRDLDTRTEGWIAGLQLAVLAMKGRGNISEFITAFTGSHRFIVDFLSEEVLSRQPESIQSFLLQTSILNRLCGPLCDAVTGRKDGQYLLEQIERSNLFLIPLDDERHWFRYHQLFRDMLHRHLLKSTPESIGGLHHRCSAWFEQNGWISEAINHALVGEEYDRAAELIEQRFEHNLLVDGVLTYLRWMRALPDEIVQLYPKLELDYAFTLTTMDAYAEAEHHLLRAEHRLSQDIQNSDINHKRLVGFAATVRMTLAFYLEWEADIIIASGMHALELLDETDIRWRTWCMVVIACSYYAAKGQLAKAESWFERIFQLIGKSIHIRALEPALHHLIRLRIIQGQLHKAQETAISLLLNSTQAVYRGVAHLELSKIHYERNELDMALQYAMEGWELVKEYDLVRLSLDGYIIRARFQQLQGAETEARELMNKAAQLIEKNNLKQTFLPVSAWQAWLWLVQGDIAAAARWAERVEATIHEKLDPALEFDHMTLARVQMAQGRLDDAQQLLERLLHAAHEGGRKGRVISISVLQALTAKMQRNIKKAIDALQSALTLAEPENYVRTFVDEGIIMLELLKETQARGIASTYVSRLLTAFDTETRRPTKSLQGQQIVGDFEPLSEREMEVLRLIAEGATNTEIAQQLFISIGTVKKHSSNIFLKLDGHTLTQAIISARKHNIL